MLVRFVVQNVYSFSENKEFNMFPRPRIRTPEGHKYNLNGFELLKLSAIYGANAAGKSNLLKALNLLKDLVIGKANAQEVLEARFKFDQSEICEQILGIEFIQSGKTFYYAIKVVNGRISEEELYLSGLGKVNDLILFERKLTEDGQMELNFLESFESDPKSDLLKSFLIEEFSNPTETIINRIAQRGNTHLKDIKLAFEWFNDSLVILGPHSRPKDLPVGIDKDLAFRKYAEDTMRAYNIGISGLDIISHKLDEVGASDEFISAIRQNFHDKRNSMMHVSVSSGDSILVEKENDDILIKELKAKQQINDGSEALFNLNELSDGTIRLLDFLPAFREIVLKPKVYVIDEIERSLHPSLAKELIKKFSDDKNTRGQLIFTTHESNLLDQSIFRQDEIWFVEKGPSGSTDIYSLSDFKEHNTIDIRKGYLNGRYGAVPFLANLHDLNWHD